MIGDGLGVQIGRKRRRPERTSGGDGWSGRAGPARRNAPARCSPCAARSRSPDAPAPSRVISRSRVTLATIEAAAIEAMMASPLITASQSQQASMRSRPSTNTSFGLHRQRRHRARQRPQRGAQDVVAVDARGRREGDRDLGGGANPGVELLARLRIELLRIVEPARHALGIEDHRGGHHRTGERSPARLVAARHRPDAALERRALAAEGRTDVLLAERQADDADGGCGATHDAMVRAGGPKSIVSARRV